MKMKTATEWWNRHIDSPDMQEVDAELVPYNIRLMMCAMFEKAWNDLGITQPTNAEHRRSAIAWFKGKNCSEEYMFSYAKCAAIIGINERRKKILDAHIQMADGVSNGKMTIT